MCQPGPGHKSQHMRIDATSELPGQGRSSRLGQMRCAKLARQVYVHTYVNFFNQILRILITTWIRRFENPRNVCTYECSEPNKQPVRLDSERAAAQSDGRPLVDSPWFTRSATYALIAILSDFDAEQASRDL
eukprot:scaffold221131_cov19-Prasinocladus_malaysianus.AAC.1